VRFELAVKALAPELKIVAPWRLWNIRSREQAIDYAEARGIPVPVTKARPYSMDRNIWHLSHEGADLEDPGNEPKDHVLLMTTPPAQAPDRAVYVEIEFERGIPVAVDGQRLPPVELLTHLNEIASANGVGVVDLLENRLVGMKSRGVYETPGGTLMYQAHGELELLTLDRMTLHYKDMLAQRYGELVYDGIWFHPLREAMDAFVDRTQRTVTGKARLKLYKGGCQPAGVWSTYSLYNAAYATFGEEDVYNQKDAEGFINLFGLPLKVQALMKKEAGLE
jgi:argininosuccinate synthase